jgi:hypothetical protein
MTRKEFILTLSKRYILPILIISILLYFGYSFYNLPNKLDTILGTLKFGGFAITLILIFGCIRLLFIKYQFLNYIFYGIMICFLIYLIFNNNFDFEKDKRQIILPILFSIFIELYKFTIKKLDKITTNI